MDQLTGFRTLIAALLSHALKAIKCLEKRNDLLLFYVSERFFRPFGVVNRRNLK